MQLTPHFTLEMLIVSETATRRGIDNRPPDEVFANLRRLAAGLEDVMVALGGRRPLINSGYRSPALNAVLGGAVRSMHTLGLAADIVCEEFGSPIEVCRAIVDAGIAYDQVIHEFGRWCHVAFAPPERAPRRQALTIASSARGYEDGILPVA
jgi:hypothetical protein